jgi:hypothetical protein
MSEDQIKTYLQKYFSDTSRSVDETRDGLESFIDEIRIMIESLDEM